MEVPRLSDALTSIVTNKKRRICYLLGLLMVIYLCVRFILSPAYLVTIPVSGGGFSEGMVGFPRFINPVLALSQTDKDLSHLIFSGLFKENHHGQIVPDLAQSYTVNEDSTTYTILLREDGTFHDGLPVTTSDVDFTYQMIRDRVVKSHLAPLFEGVNWEIQGERTIIFNLQNSQANFIESLTVGILSANHWADISPEEFAFASNNIAPVGAGPFMISDINRNSEEKITSYVLSAHSTHLSPYITTIEVRFYENHEKAIAAFESGLIDNLANISPQELLLLDHTLETKHIISYPLDRSFSLFMNPITQPLFANKALRQALDKVIDKEQIINDVLFKRGDLATGPLPTSHLYYRPPDSGETQEASSLEEVLEEEGWRPNEAGWYAQEDEILEISLHVPQVQELEQVAYHIKDQFESLGLQTRVETVPQEEIISSVIRQRDYQMLLFGQLAEDASALYAFWHSHGQQDPGINISLYENKTVDAILERLLSGSDPTTRETDYVNLQKEIGADVPVIFLYHPHFIYALDKKIQNVNLGDLRFAWDRFNTLPEWYIRTESLLPWFVP